MSDENEMIEKEIVEKQVIKNAPNLIYYLEDCKCKIQSWKIDGSLLGPQKINLRDKPPYEYFQKCPEHENKKIEELFPVAEYLCECKKVFNKRKNKYEIRKKCESYKNNHEGRQPCDLWPLKALQIWEKTNKLNFSSFKGLNFVDSKTGESVIIPPNFLPPFPFLFPL